MIDQATLRFVLHFARAYPLRSLAMVVLLSFAGLAGGVGVVTMVPLLEVVESGGQPTSTIGRSLAGILGAVGVQMTVMSLLSVIVVTISAKAVFLWFAMRQVGYTVAQVTRDIRLRLIRSLLGARWLYFGKRTAGSFANAISGEALRAAFSYRSACQIFADLFQILVYVAISVVISLRVTMVAVVAGAVLLYLLRGFVHMSRKAGEDQTRLTRSLTGRLVDVLQGMKPVKAMAREDLVLPLLEQETEGLNEAQKRQVIAAETRRMLHEPAVTALLAAVLFVLLEVGDAPLSAVLVLAFIFYRLMQHINTLQDRYQSMVMGESAFWSMNEQIEEAEAQQERTAEGASANDLRDSVRFENVSFHYEPGKPVLQDVDLTIPKGSFVAIFGESGSGKTTLADLLLGLLRPTEGEVWVDDRPLGELSLRSWRHRIGYVPQELLLFNDTIFRNITLGDPGLTREDAERALRMADALDFVEARDQGLDTEVGDKGGMLSGGQRQRIAIARALVGRPSLLVLDEVTTALDPDTERAVCDTLRDLAGEVTILSISHQPAMREAADLAYLVRDGRVESVPAQMAELG